MANLSYLGQKPIAVLGAGAVGRTHAADCSLAGKDVRLFELPEFGNTLGSIAEDGCITVEGPQVNFYGFQRSGKAKISKVTTDIKAAVSGAGVLIVAMPAIGFDKLFELLIPNLEDGQIVHFMTGNFGSILLRNLMKKKHCGKNVIIGEWSSQPYGTRIKTLANVLLPSVGVIYRAITLKAAALPQSDTDLFIESGKYIPSLDSVKKMVKGDTVLDICFTNVNPVLHCPGTILGVGVMENYGQIFGSEKYNFSIYSHAYCPSISEVQYGFYLEQRKIAKAIGFGMEEYQKEEFFSRTNILGKEFLGKGGKIDFPERYELLEATGPFTINNRYITEDIPVGCCVQRALGNKFGVKTPIIDSMVTLASVMSDIDYSVNCWTLEKLGIADMDKEQLMKYMNG